MEHVDEGQIGARGRESQLNEDTLFVFFKMHTNMDFQLDQLAAVTDQGDQINLIFRTTIRNNTSPVVFRMPREAYDKKGRGEDRDVILVAFNGLMDDHVLLIKGMRGWGVTMPDWRIADVAPAFSIEHKVKSEDMKLAVLAHRFVPFYDHVNLDAASDAIATLHLTKTALSSWEASIVAFTCHVDFFSMTVGLYIVPHGKNPLAIPILTGKDADPDTDLPPERIKEVVQRLQVCGAAEPFDGLDGYYARSVVYRARSAVEAEKALKEMATERDHLITKKQLAEAAENRRRETELAEPVRLAALEVVALSGGEEHPLFPQEFVDNFLREPFVQQPAKQPSDAHATPGPRNQKQSPLEQQSRQNTPQIVEARSRQPTPRTMEPPAQQQPPQQHSQQSTPQLAQWAIQQPSRQPAQQATQLALDETTPPFAFVHQTYSHPMQQFGAQEAPEQQQPVEQLGQQNFSQALYHFSQQTLGQGMQHFDPHSTPMAQLFGLLSFQQPPFQPDFQQQGFQQPMAQQQTQQLTQDSADTFMQETFNSFPQQPYEQAGGTSGQQFVQQTSN
ncbi:hypothetical protein M406DRAFT_353975 [Cryphonectria parasitica EP155]|uniref:Uncharacterized protein n=1 Tax=Cryphonectria parasitica (strain ATCC 38755 / EP155) TaxID=660469 RepID=A0A9P5CHL0_CRYP1|nr:uncharacterized protein M406DRAFT_353975 [Cryphonectria parasitica EP155]KAF3760023.1 hypothetical protein M406DRAFT_353975 [Cryphonectria parasitica EP155]